MSVDGSAGRATSASGVNKGNAYVGSSRSGPVTVSASVAFDREPATGTQNHWHVLLRRLGIRTYYAAYLMPAAGGNPATLSIMTAKDGVFDTPAIVTLPFAVAAGTRYVIEARVGDDASGTTVQARAWPAGQTAPAWEASWTDVDADRILSGQVGVRISVYSSPATATVDDFTVTAA
jgi:hypothetical protein